MHTSIDMQDRFNDHMMTLITQTKEDVALAQATINRKAKRVYDEVHADMLSMIARLSDRMQDQLQEIQKKQRDMHTMLMGLVPDPCSLD